MSAPAHTSEPWSVHEQGEPNQWCLPGPDGRWVLGLIHNGEMPPEKQRATLDRIAACVNACAGVSNEALRLGGPFAAARAAITERAEMAAEIERLRGITPEFPPRPAHGNGPEHQRAGMPRFGLRWNGPQQPLGVPMADGYWTPWHMADEAAQAIERERDAYADGLQAAAEIARIADGQASRFMQERDQLAEALRNLVGSLATLKSGDYAIARDSIPLDAARELLAGVRHG